MQSRGQSAGEALLPGNKCERQLSAGIHYSGFCLPRIWDFLNSLRQPLLQRAASHRVFYGYRPSQRTSYVTVIDEASEVVRKGDPGSWSAEILSCKRVEAACDTSGRPGHDSRARPTLDPQATLRRGDRGLEPPRPRCEA